MEPREAFDLILDVIRPTLVEQGYQLHEEREHPEAFGSRYVVYTHYVEGIRFVWDVKERWSVLEYAPDNVYSRYPCWLDLLRVRWDIFDQVAVREIAEDFQKELKPIPQHVIIGPVGMDKTSIESPE